MLPPPLLPELPVVLLVSVVVVLIVTVAVFVAVPPGVPETDNESVHVPVEEPAVTAQFWDVEAEPTIVPIVLVAEETVHALLLESVAVAAVDAPAVSVPRFCIVALTVKLLLGETVADDGVIETTLSSAAETTVTEPQSAVHVVPILTHTDWAPFDDGVIEKSTDVAWPLLYVFPATDVTKPVYQFPVNSAVTLCDCDCWFVTETVSVPLVSLYIVDVETVHEYCEDESHELLHAAKTGNENIAIATSNRMTRNEIFFLFIFKPFP